MGFLAREPASVQAWVVGGSEMYPTRLSVCFARRHRLDGPDTRRRAIETWTSMLGALFLARAVVRADSAFSDEVLAICRVRLAR